MVWLKVFLSLFLYSSAATQTFDVKPISVGGKGLKAAIADDQAKRTQGLMFVDNWKAYQGMLFIFPRAQMRMFWMKNTLLPLSLGFFDENKTLFEIVDLNPAKSLAQKEVERARSSRPARYVLEVPQGWFKKSKVKVGSKLRY